MFDRYSVCTHRKDRVVKKVDPDPSFFHNGFWYMMLFAFPFVVSPFLAIWPWDWGWFHISYLLAWLIVAVVVDIFYLVVVCLLRLLK
jgi:hypothetical protein